MAWISYTTELTSNHGRHPLGVAKVLKDVVDAEKPDLVFLGEQAIDDVSNQTGQMLAALLNWSQATFASKVELGNGSAKVPGKSNPFDQFIPLLK